MPAFAYERELQAAAAAEHVDPNLLRALVMQESGGNPSAGSSAGAVGLTQLMPATAASVGVKNRLDPVQSLRGGARYLRQQLDRYSGNVSNALAAYNAGPGAVDKYGGIPPFRETQNYVRSILANYKPGSANGTPVIAGAAATGDAQSSGGNPFDSLLQSATTGLLWIALILGGAALVALGVGRLAAGRQATA